jgi:hypothetical protein
MTSRTGRTSQSDPPNNVVATLYGSSTVGEINVNFYGNLTGIHCTGAGDPGYNVTVNTFDSAGGATDQAFMIAIN